LKVIRRIKTLQPFSIVHERRNLMKGSTAHTE
jgi:hypothetical protein